MGSYRGRAGSFRSLLKHGNGTFTPEFSEKRRPAGGQSATATDCQVARVLRADRFERRR